MHSSRGYRTRDGIIGEELGSTGTAARQWVIDPIDGTQNFVRGVPVWATLIALLDQGEPVMGLISAPALQRRGGLHRVRAHTLVNR